MHYNNVYVPYIIPPDNGAIHYATDNEHHTLCIASTTSAVTGTSDCYLNIGNYHTITPSHYHREKKAVTRLPYSEAVEKQRVWWSEQPTEPAIEVIE